MIKKILTICICLASSVGFASEKAVVLMYHGITTIKNPMNVSLKMFEEQMDYLKNNNFNIIGADDLVDSIINKSELPEKSVVITFDDGWKNQAKAMEVLKNINLKQLLDWF